MIFTSPLAIVLPRKTKKDRRVILNLNNYPNWSFFLYADLKRNYSEYMRSQLEGVKIKTPCKITFTLHRKNHRMGDRQNVLAVHEKFFCDSATFYKCWEDDSDIYIVETVYKTGEIDHENPRVDIEITSI